MKYPQIQCQWVITNWSIISPYSAIKVPCSNIIWWNPPFSYLMLVQDSFSVSFVLHTFHVSDFASNCSSCCYCSFELCLKFGTQFWEQLKHLMAHEAFILVLVCKFATFLPLINFTTLLFQKIKFVLKASEISDVFSPKM